MDSPPMRSIPFLWYGHAHVQATAEVEQLRNDLEVANSTIQQLKQPEGALPVSLLWVHGAETRPSCLWGACRPLSGTCHVGWSAFFYPWSCQVISVLGFFLLLLVSREAILLPWGPSALWVKQLAEQQEMAWQTAEAPAASAEVWPLPLQQHGCDADLALARNALHGLWCN